MSSHEPLPGCSPEQMSIYDAIMPRIEVLMHTDPAAESEDGIELTCLTTVAMFYERNVFPSEPDNGQSQAPTSSEF